MTNLKQTILNTIDIIVDQKIKNLKFDKTVKGTVVEILENNYYKIQIQNVFYKLKYNKKNLSLHTTVYVLIPNNNYKNMFILCEVEK